MKIKNKKPVWIVFEGLDKSGKTTLARMLQNNTKNSTYVKGVCSPTWIGSITKIMPTTLLFVLELLYIAVRVKLLLRRGKSVIQDRYLASIACHLPVTQKFPNNFFLWLTARISPKPNMLIYCTVENRERIKRIENQNEINKHERWLLDNPEWIDRRDRAYLHYYQKFRNKKYKLDTTYKTPGNVFKKLSKQIKNRGSF